MIMPKQTIIELCKEQMGFSAGHFTIFSKTQREKLHGHNYQVYCALTTDVPELGLMFDYRVYKRKIIELARRIHLSFLLPAHCPHLILEEEGDYIYAHFNDQKIPFLKQDVTVLPLSNITVEALSQWFLDALVKDDQSLVEHAIQKIVVKVSNTPGTWGQALWQRAS